MKIRLILILIVHSAGMFCNFYPLDEKACIQKTEGISCQFNFFQNACIETQSTSLGCSPNLNKNACLQQLQNTDGTEARCYFGKKCINVNISHLKRLGCDNNFSLYACVNLKSEKCQWINNTCVTFSGVAQQADSCKNSYMTPVNTALCALIPELKCQSNGFKGGYQCVDVPENQLSLLTCDTLGLSQMTCVSITTSNQKCIFQNSQCQAYISQKIGRCSESLNKHLCLSITDPSLFCQWTNQGCADINIFGDCESMTQVNPSACRKALGSCEYDDVLNKCKVMRQSVSCNTPGLNKEGCISIVTEKCIFYKGQCKIASDEELNLFDCEQIFNELACINITTPSQYCLWNGNKCQRQFINQNTECPLIGQGFTVNGNTCRAISKQNQGCKYNKSTRLCQASSPVSDSCTTSFLNLYGCVQVQTNIACRWNTEKFQCEEAKVVEQLTKCEDLGYSNAIACSQVLEPITTTTNKAKVVLGCYYNADIQQCKKTDSKILSTINCNQPGLNKYGCSLISKVGQRCRWIRGTCTTIIRRESIAGVNCLDLQFSNQGTCALAQANKEVCKYSSDALGCVNTLNSSKDGDQCSSPGLNSFACAQITRNQNGCYYDKINNICVEGPDSGSSDQAIALQSAELLSTAKCVASSPTLNICIAIKTLGELCAWDSRMSSCGYQFVQFNEKCLDYNTVEKQKINPDAKINVNANVCASIPDYDPKAAVKPTDQFRGYCQFDGKGNCIIYTQSPCSDNCCTTQVGINAHVCSRYTNRSTFCYFNEYNKCVQLTNDDTDISSKEQVKAFYNYKQYKCSSMNILSCAWIEWSPKQQCFWNGNVCTQINYGDYSEQNYLLIFSGQKISKYACLGIEATKTNINKYFNYDPVVDDQALKCVFVPTELKSCNEFLVNMNKCLGLTPNLYCQWNKQTMQCSQLDDYLELRTCNEYQNKKACINNPYAPCLFVNSSDKCISSPQEVECDEFGNANSDYFGWVNEKACANITKAGQICKFYTVENKCITASDSSQSCDLPGINSIGCYARTTGNCRWDPTNLECYEIDLAILPTLKCTDNVNKTVCLMIPLYPCEWNATNMKCNVKSSFLTIDSNTQQNAQTCTLMVGGAYYYDSSTSTCKSLTNDNNDCTTKIMNKQGCLLNTKGSKCIFDSSQLPENKCQQFKLEQEVCTSSLINIEICMNIPAACYFDISDLTCKVAKLSSSIKCSSLISATLHYNKLACSSISASITDPFTDGIKACLESTTKDPALNLAQQCNFEKYCFWDTKLYGCSIYKIVNSTFSPATSDSNGGGSPASCSLQPNLITKCSQIYSAAVCLEFGEGCFFDIAQGGCKPYATNLFKVSSCSQINGDQCTQSKTATAYCSKQVAADSTPNCSFDPSITSTCVSDASFVKQSCSSLSSSTDCAQASDDCFLNTNCVSPSSSDVITCSTPGVSQSLCLSLTPPCDFSSGKCTPLTIPTLESDNYYYVCYEVNLLTTKKSELACASITTSPCKYSNSSCSNAFYQICSSLKDLSVSQLACNQCQGDKAYYNPITYQCLIISTLPTDCDLLKQTDCSTTSCQWDSANGKCQINTLRLNQLSCLQLTDKILAKWDSTLNNCITLTTSQAQQETDCSIQSIKSCLVANNNCWVSSNQCQQSNQISSSCDDINQAKAQSSQCLVSVQQACKWVNNKCTTADLTSDNCSVLNKYGCLNIQQKVNCGWSDKDIQCKQINLQNNSNSCTKYVSGSDSNYNQVNPYSCSSLQNGKCYWNSTNNQCASVGNAVISCKTNFGINKTACIQSTTGKCKFDTSTNSCIEITNSDTECSVQMNQEACLSLQSCQFSNYQCTKFSQTTITTIDAASLAPNSVISPQICTYYNTHIAGAYFIYDSARGYCVNANKPNPSLYIAQCSSIGINSKICLEKTNEYCQYSNSECTKVSLSSISSQTNCNSAYNWYACTKQNQNCKFQDGKCQSLLLTDTCLTLSSVIVAPRICAQMNTACQYNSSTYGCQPISDANQSCSAIGISKQGCLKNTSKSYCYFDANNYQCSDNYDRTLSCLDANKPQAWFINQNLCYFVKSLGSYCYFDNDQCRQLTDLQISSCYDSKTNSITCSKAKSDILCFYNTSEQKCSQVLATLQLQQWYNSNSFNKKACISFESTTDPRKTIWDDIKGCLELSTTDLANIQCSSPVNRLGCISITNPTQFCQFNTVTSKCVGFDYTVPPESNIGTCASLSNVNRPEFCQYASDACQFNGASKRCVTSTIQKSDILGPSDCSNKGFSKAICDTLYPKCNFSNERKLCYGGDVFCIDASTPTKCAAVQGEPCWFKTKCEGIKYSDLDIVGCSDVSNYVGCTSITNPSIVCQFDQSKVVCNQVVDFSKDCSSYTNINSGKACEQTTKIACKFDFASKSCKNVSLSDVFECDRGLNYLACTNQTRPSLQCQFGKFCYGPTFGVTKCADMLNASTCLNYTYQCTWDSTNNVCQSYVTGLTCQQLEANKTIVSSQVCYNSKADQGACIYNTDTNTCKFITPQNCQQLETKSQCIQFKSLPCLWVDGQCTFYTLLSTDLCSTIGQNGTQRACMDVYRQGEFCIYSGNQCSEFIEVTDGSSNCLDSINIISCVQQQRSQCLWKITTSQVWVNSKDQMQYSSGVCLNYQADSNQECAATLSFLSCFSVSKSGQYCRWLNGQCVNILPTSANTKIYYNSYQLINANSCGLVNAGKVKYSEETKSCVLITASDILTCKCGQETKGLNKYACLSIKNENCIWNDTYKTCLEHHSTCSHSRLLTENICYRSHVQPKDCQLLNARESCGYYQGNCIWIDTNEVNCNYPGLNQYSCENITQQCYWDNENKQCQDLENANSDEKQILFGLILLILYI